MVLPNISLWQCLTIYVTSFGKADGAFLGKVKNEETLGNDMHIEGMIKIDNNAFCNPVPYGRE